MREIKFRAYAQADKTWHYWDVHGGYPDGIYGGLSEPQEYTGVKDENKVDIYEGDVVRVHFFNKDGDLHNIYSEVVHIENGFYEQWDGFDVAKVKTHRGPRNLRNSCKVVGNIFEKELTNE